METFNVQQNLHGNTTPVAPSARILLPHMPIQFDQDSSVSKHVVEAFVGDLEPP
jgi:hypothetical protein